MAPQQTRGDANDLQGLKVLVVEDESMVSMLMEDMLRDLGCTVVGTVARFEEALRQATNDPAFDVALLDVNLNGKQTFPIAEQLAARGVRFIFATGYGEGILPQSLQSGPILQKPFELRALQRALQRAIAR